MSRILNVWLLIATVPFLAASQCLSHAGEHAGEEAAKQARAAIDNAIGKIDADASAWRQEVDQLGKTLLGQGRQDLAAEVQGVITHATASVGTEIKCTTDFVGRRVSESLRRIRAKLLGEKIPPSPPAFCQASPAYVDLSVSYDLRNVISIYGYDMAPDAFSVVIVDDAAKKETDISRFVQVPTHYLMTINVSRYPFNCTTAEIDIKTKEGRTFSSIAVTPKMMKDPAKMLTIAQQYQSDIAGCSNQCCSYASEGECIRNRCNEECAQRNKNNPEGHPAIGDACSTSGEFWKWCHNNFCRNNATCRADWCSDSAPARKACLDTALAKRVAAEATVADVAVCYH